ncbi:hypothetical protein D1872_228710 [compost metagenome]
MIGKINKYSSLVQKDYEYIEFILRHGVVTAKQIMLKFLEPSIHRVYRRLQKLQTRGYVKNERLTKNLGVYYSTVDARNELEMNVTVPSNISMYTVQHDLLLTDLVLYFGLTSEKNGLQFRYQSERELRFEVAGKGVQPADKLKAVNQNRDRIPDAVFYIQRPDGESTEQRIWVELEMSIKDKKRYTEKFTLFDSLLSAGQYQQIYYFAGSLKIKNALNAAREPLINAKRVHVRDVPEDILQERWEKVLPPVGEQPEDVEESNGGTGTAEP